MNELKIKLKSKIKKEAEDVFCVCCGHYGEAYEAGANSLVPIVYMLVEALEKVNREEVNSMRPGGYYSKSATISFDALAEIRKVIEEK